MRRTLALTLSLVAGCYDAHGLAGRDAGRDAPSSLRPPPLDAGPPAAMRDAGPRPDVGPVLPVEPEPDPMPDEPPTGPWDDVPPPPPEGPALEPAGEPVPIDDETDTGGPPILVWNGEGWGVVWGGGPWSSQGTLAILDADGVPLHRVSFDSEARAAYALDFAIGRYAIVSAGGLGATYDRVGRPATDWARAEPPFAGDRVDVARLPIAHGWLVASGTDGGGEDEDTAIRAYVLDETMTRTAPSAGEIGVGMGEIRVGTAKTRALVAWTTRTGIRGQVLANASLEPRGEPFDILSLPLISDAEIDVELFRDRLVVAGMGGGEVRARFVDPFSDFPVTTPPIVLGRSRVGDRRPGIAAASEHGFLTVCWATGPGPWGGGAGSDDGVALQVVGADGTLWGDALQLVEGEANVGGVACGWNGEDVVVIWWRASGDGAFNTMFSQRVHPTFL